jgi:hypothetical protein
MPGETNQEVARLQLLRGPAIFMSSSSAIDESSTSVAHEL